MNGFVYNKAATLKVSNKSCIISFEDKTRICAVDSIKELNAYKNGGEWEFFICGIAFNCNDEQFNQLLKVIL